MIDKKKSQKNKNIFYGFPSKNCYIAREVTIKSKVNNKGSWPVVREYKTVCGWHDRCGSLISSRFYLFFITLLLASVAYTDNEKRSAELTKFDIKVPILDVAEGLNQLADQTDTVLLYPYQEAKARQANAVVGHYTLMEALSILLQGSGLSGGLSENGVVKISLIENSHLNKKNDKERDVKKKKSFLASFIHAALFGTTASVVADTSATEAANTAPSIEEIVITANKTGAVSLQDTAGSITAIASDSLEKAQVEGFEDYIKLVPGLTSVSSGPGQSQMVIRGLNAERIVHNQPQTRSLVGLYIDDMPISVAGFNPDLGVVDIERIEVLRGPQGTLYGSSSMAGTVRIITKRPDTEEVSGYVGSDVSWTKDGDMNWGLKGSVNIPFTDNIAMRASTYTNEKGGFIDNVAPGFEEKDYNSSSTFGGKFQLGFYGDKLEAVATVMYNDLESDGQPDEYIPNPSDPQVSAIDDELQTIKVVQDEYDQEFLGFSLNIDYDMGSVILTSATSVFDVEIDKHLDDTFRVRAVTPIVAPFSDYQAQETLDTVIQELRLASNNESKWQWVIGAYYESNEREFVQTQPTPGLNAFFQGPMGGPPFCPSLTSTCFGAVADSVFDGRTTIETDQYAVFGEATYSFTDALRLKLGFRYFDYESDVFLFGSGVANGGVSIDENTIKEDDWVPKVELTYDISEDHLVYASFSEGFRLGGVNGFVPVACGPELVSLGAGLGEPFESDSVTNYEVGAKTAWMDNRLIANVTVYRNEFEDIQTNITLACGFSHFLNAGELENTGIEGDFMFQASEELLFRVGFSYVDSEVTEGIPMVNVKGDEPPYVPDFTASGGVEYGVPVRDGFGFIRTDVRYVASSSNEFSSDPSRSTLPSYTIVDLTLGYEINDWGFSLFAKNLFNDEVITNIDPDRVQPDQLSRGIPRTVGLSVKREF